MRCYCPSSLLVSFSFEKHPGTIQNSSIYLECTCTHSDVRCTKSIGNNEMEWGQNNLILSDLNTITIIMTRQHWENYFHQSN